MLPYCAAKQAVQMLRSGPIAIPVGAQLGVPSPRNTVPRTLPSTGLALTTSSWAGIVYQMLPSGPVMMSNAEALLAVAYSLMAR